MQIYGPSYLHGTQAIGAPHATRGAQPSAATAPSGIRDELQISDAGNLIDQVRSLPDIRQDRVAQIRESIAAGTYLTPDKLDSAVERLLDEVA